MSRSQTVPASTCRALSYFATQRGIVVDFPGLDSTERRLEMSLYVEFLSELKEAEGEAVGLHVLDSGRCVVDEMFLALAHSAPTVGEGLRAVLRYQRLVFPEPVFLEELNDRFIVRGVPTGPLHSAQDVAGNIVLGTVLKLVHSLVGEPVLPTRLLFRHDSPEHPETYERWFGLSPSFSSMKDLIEFPTVVLEKPARRSNSNLFCRLQEQLEPRLNALAPLKDDETLYSRAYSLIGELVAMGAPSVNEVATCLHLSARSLQRKLNERCSSVRELIECAREEQARELIRAGVGIDDVSERLGYRELSSFRHAFVRWTGFTPGDYREFERGRT